MGLRGRNSQSIEREISVEQIEPRIKGNGKERVARIIEFLETLPVTSGILVGTKFKVRPWQKKIIRDIYGNVRDSKRVVRTAVITMPRKNGKTGLTAGLALCHLCGPEAEPRGRIYSAASDRAQAALIFDEMKAMIQQTKELRDRIIIRDHAKEFEDAKNGSEFQSISADANTKHGYSPSCIIYDELAQALDRRLFDALTTSMGARSEPLMIVISTQSPDNNHVMSELVDYGIQVNSGVVTDETFYACIFSAPADSNPWSEQTWKECNPALGDFRSLEEMRTFASQAQRIPAKEAAFRLLYLNQRIAMEHRFITPPDWMACATKIDIDDLRGRTCYGALDLSGSGKNDLTAMVLIFPMDDGRQLIFPYFWVCESGLDRAEHNDRAPYKLWVQQGHVIALPANVMDLGFVAQTVKQATNKFDFRVLGIDPWKKDDFIHACDQLGIDLAVQPHGQGFKEMDSSIKLLEDNIIARRLQHNGNPALAWCMDNVRVEPDSAGNRKFTKRKSTGRIDGAVALVMAEGVTAGAEEETKEYQILIL